MGTSGGLRGADVMQGLLRAPQQFDFSQAMELLEASDPQGAVFGQGLEKRVRLLPDDNLVFPASDIRGCQQQSPQLTLLMGFFGLYGVDAPVPHYLLDRTTAEDDDATRMRDFLIFSIHASMPCYIGPCRFPDRRRGVYPLLSVAVQMRCLAGLA